jgi:aspartokinase
VLHVGEDELSQAAQLGAEVISLSSSALQLTLVIDRAHAKALTRALHEALIDVSVLAP